MIKKNLSSIINTLLFIGIFIPQFIGASEKNEKTGDILQIVIPTIGLGSTIFYEKELKGTKQFLKSLITTALITKSLKLATRKQRPNGECCQSFPSGHTSVAFMGAAFIHKRYGCRYSIPAYVGATFVGYSRVQADKHFVEDVIAGAAVGILSSFYFTKSYKGFIIDITVTNGYEIYLSQTL